MTLKKPEWGPELRHIRQEFPILQALIHGFPLSYLDNAATTQKPKAVLARLAHYYEHENANIHRGVHSLSSNASDAFEKARLTVQKFIGARHQHECIFTKGTTDGINLVAYSFGEAFVKPGDEILITALEHHSNIVPWQMLCARKGAHLKVLPIDTHGELQLEALPELLNEKTKLLAISHVSNALGTLNPIAKMFDLAHQYGAAVLIDGAQSAAHISIDVQKLDCDFFLFSGHKIYGPTGIGLLYGKEKWLEQMPPYQGGGDMILSVSFEKTLYNELPYKFEAGTPAIGEAIAMATALEFLNQLDSQAVFAYEAALLQYTEDALLTVPGLHIIGRAKEKAAVVSFVMDGIHPHDIGTIADSMGVAIRTGHHCAMPLMQFLNLPATARASLALYNTAEDIDQLITALWAAKKVFKQ